MPDDRQSVAGRPLLSASAHHLVNRFSYGVTPGLAADVRRAGGPREWFERQLHPEKVDDPGVAATRDWWGPSLRLGASELWQRHVQEVEPGWEVMANYARWALVRRIRSRRQVQEVMAEFWENHFNVPADGDAQFLFRTDYGVRLRRLALTSFEQLLQQAVTHPAMLIYLDQAVSTRRAPNENLGRELLELHTVGRDSYTEDDVKSSARILTGWRVAMWSTWDTSYVPDDHWTGPVQVLGFSDPNADKDGRDLTRRYLSYLAHHPATAQRVARRLAVKFVRDDPPQSLVDRLAAVYLEHGTQIKPVLRALVRSVEFAGARGAKLRDPAEDVVAAYRALGVKILEPRGGDSAANAILWQAAGIGARPFSWPRPDGQPLDNRSWASVARLVSSLSVHYTLSGGWWPNKDVRYPSPTSRAPRFPVRFEVLVDALSRQLLHRPASRRLLGACCDAVGCRPEERITRDHPVMKWDSPRLLTTLLDSPEFFSR